MKGRNKKKQNRVSTLTIIQKTPSYLMPQQRAKLDTLLLIMFVTSRQLKKKSLGSLVFPPQRRACKVFLFFPFRLLQFSKDIMDAYLPMDKQEREKHILSKARGWISV